MSLDFVFAQRENFRNFKKSENRKDNMKFSGIFKKYLSTTTLLIAGTALVFADDAASKETTTAASAIEEAAAENLTDTTADTAEVTETDETEDNEEESSDDDEDGEEEEEEEDENALSSGGTNFDGVGLDSVSVAGTTVLAAEAVSDGDSDSDSDSDSDGSVTITQEKIAATNSELDDYESYFLTATLFTVTDAVSNFVISSDGTLSGDAFVVDGTDSYANLLFTGDGTVTVTDIKIDTGTLTSTDLSGKSLIVAGNTSVIIDGVNTTASGSGTNGALNLGLSLSVGTYSSDTVDDDGNLISNTATLTFSGGSRVQTTEINSVVGANGQTGILNVEDEGTELYVYALTLGAGATVLTTTASSGEYNSVYLQSSEAYTALLGDVTAGAGIVNVTGGAKLYLGFGGDDTDDDTTAGLQINDGTVTVSGSGSELIFADGCILEMDSDFTETVEGTCESSLVISGGGKVYTEDGGTLSSIQIGTYLTATSSVIKMTVTGDGSSLDLMSSGIISFLSADNEHSVDLSSGDLSVAVSDGATASFETSDSIEICYLAGYAGTVEAKFSADGEGSTLTLAAGGDVIVARSPIEETSPDSFTVDISATNGGAIALSGDEVTFGYAYSRSSSGLLTVNVSASGGGSVTVTAAGDLYASRGAGDISFSSSGSGSVVTMTTGEGENAYFCYRTGSNGADTQSVSVSASDGGEVSVTASSKFYFAYVTKSSFSGSINISASDGGKVSLTSGSTFYLVYFTAGAELTSAEVSATSGGTVALSSGEDMYVANAKRGLDLDISADGSDSLLSMTSAENLYIGYDACTASNTTDDFSVSVSVTDGGAVVASADSGTLYIGEKTGAGAMNTSVTVSADGAGSTAALSGGNIYIGYVNKNTASGSLDIDISATNGGAVSINASNGSITAARGYTADDVANVSFIASGSDTDGNASTLTLTASDCIYLARDATSSSSYTGTTTASVTVSDGASAALSATTIYVGYQASGAYGGSVATLTASGENSSLTLTASAASDDDDGTIYFGYTASTNTATQTVSLVVSDGASATLSADNIYLGTQYTSSTTGALSATLSATGTNSVLSLSGTLIETAAYYATDDLAVSISASDGATLSTDADQFVLQNATLSVSGADSDGNSATWKASGKISVDDDTATATIAAGGAFYGEDDASLTAGTLTIAGGELSGTLTIAGGTVALSDNATVSAAVNVVVLETYLLSAVTASDSTTASAKAATISVTAVSDDSSDVTVAVSSDGTATVATGTTVTISADVDYVQTLVNDLVAGTAVEYNFQLFDAAAIAALAEAGVTVELDEIWDTFTEIEATLSTSTGVLTLTLAIPEPSSFALLAGTFALALAASRRRRSRKAA